MSGGKVLFIIGMSMERNVMNKVTASSSLVVIVDSSRAHRDLNQGRIRKEEIEAEGKCA